MVTAKTSTKKTKLPVEDVTVVSPLDLGLTDDNRKSVCPETYAQYIRALMQNWRQGTVACKGRSDVSFSNKKPWKQKGTGRARAGSARSPLWRSGGVTFGPQPRVRTMKIGKTMRISVGNKLLWDQLDNKKIFALDWEPTENAPKTRDAAGALKKSGLEGRNIVFFVNPDDRFTHASFANIPFVRMMLFDQWNAYDASNASAWMVLKKDLASFKEMVQRWI